MWDSTDHLVQYSAASTDCFKGRCNGDILTINVSSDPHELQTSLHSVTRLKKHKQNILDIPTHLLSAMTLDILLFLIFSLLCALSSCLGCSHVPAREQSNLVTLFRRQILPCSRFDLVISATVLLFSSYQT